MEKKDFDLLFGKYIRNARESKGFSREKLSGLAIIDPSTIERIENGESGPKNYTNFKLAYALDVSIDELYHKARVELNKEESEK